MYDEETGLYYLRSRYYNPNWGRFINADALLGKVGGLFSHNLFSYCNNSPIVCVDNVGKKPIICLPSFDEMQKTYGLAYKDMQEIATCLEAELAVGGGIGVELDLYGLAEVGAYGGVDMLRLTCEDGLMNIDQALAVDLSLTIAKYYGASYSYRKPRSLVSPGKDIPAEIDYLVNMGKLELTKEGEIKMGYSFEAGLGLSARASMALNVTKYMGTRFAKNYDQSFMRQTVRNAIFINDSSYAAWVNNIRRMLGL